MQGGGGSRGAHPRTVRAGRCTLGERPACPEGAFSGVLLRRKAQERARFLASLEADPSTLVFYEAPHRIRPFLKEALKVFRGRECVVGRELTKRFEWVGTVSDPEQIPERGEFVVLFGPPPARAAIPLSPEEAVSRVGQFVEEGIEEKEALRRVAREMGVRRREVYAIVKGNRT